jgi:hypothetical protein
MAYDIKVRLMGPVLNTLGNVNGMEHRRPGVKRKVTQVKEVRWGVSKPH